MIHSHKEDLSEKISEIFKLYGKMMYDVAFSILQNIQDAEDAVQNTLLKLIEKSNQIDMNNPESKSMRALIRIMTRNTAINMLRKKQLHQLFDTNAEENQIMLSLFSSDEPIYQAHELKVLLYELDIDEQKILYLKYWEKLTYKQIGDKLGISEKAANSRVWRAQQHLKVLYLSEGKGDKNE
jgi:RNA polymerase sigma-70 factor (ECF subfamily)